MNKIYDLVSKFDINENIYNNALKFYEDNTSLEQEILFNDFSIQGSNGTLYIRSYYFEIKLSQYKVNFRNGFSSDNMLRRNYNSYGIRVNDLNYDFDFDLNELNESTDSLFQYSTLYPEDVIIQAQKLASLNLNFGCSYIRVIVKDNFYREAENIQQLAIDSTNKFLKAFHG